MAFANIEASAAYVGKIEVSFASLRLCASLRLSEVRQLSIDEFATGNNGKVIWQCLVNSFEGTGCTRDLEAPCIEVDCDLRCCIHSQPLQDTQLKCYVTLHYITTGSNFGCAALVLMLALRIVKVASSHLTDCAWTLAGCDLCFAFLCQYLS